MVENNKNLSNEVQKSILNDINNLDFKLVEKEVGVVSHVEDSIILVKGLTKVGFDEAVIIADKFLGFVAVMEGDLIKVVLLDKTVEIKVGDEVKRTKKYLEVPVGEALMGRVIDGIGRPVDGLGSINCKEYLPAERPSKGILDRQSVDTPLETGIKVVDCLIPIGRGQRELILGDRQTGKTSIAIDAILHQKGKDVICIYCAIGQRDATVRNVIYTLQEHDAMDYTIVVDANATSMPGIQYIAPFSATSIAEYFCEKGKAVLIVYDDLSKHAKTYREISLLLEKSPGREAYPGDVFYLHSRLLERSINLKKELGGGSITSLPVIETEGENISAYIPTNVISITDGQLYLSPSNYQKGILPAIDVGKSVSRVGSKAQLKAFKQVAGRIGIEFSQFEELEMFSKFATKLDDQTQKTINKGKLIREILKQNKSETVSVEGQVAILICLNRDAFNDIALEKIASVEKEVVNLMKEKFPDLVNTIRKNEKLSDVQINTFLESAKEIVEKYKNK
ncbi:MAG TPA: F0F1 ATP synthase subunit alpha [Rickettsiales bacterium]|nr:F0F1 ATP synthase subunit alpha [Rickettsiales bacterium]